MGMVSRRSWGCRYEMILTMSSIDTPIPERNLLSLSSFSIMRIKFRKAMLKRKAITSSFIIDLCMIFIVEYSHILAYQCLLSFAEMVKEENPKNDGFIALKVS